MKNSLKKNIEAKDLCIGKRYSFKIESGKVYDGVLYNIESDCCTLVDVRGIRWRVALEELCINDVNKGSRYMQLKCKKCGGNRCLCYVVEELTGPANEDEFIYDEVTKCETINIQHTDICFDCGGPMEAIE